MSLTPMFLSSVRLMISNPGFTLGFEPNVKLSGTKTFCIVLADLALFLLHPIILQFNISSLKIQQKALKKSKDLNYSTKYDKNLRRMIRMKNQLYSYKRLELNLESMFQMTISLVLYLYAKSETTITNSLKAVFSKARRP